MFILNLKEMLLQEATYAGETVTTLNPVALSIIILIWVAVLVYGWSHKLEKK